MTMQGMGDRFNSGSGAALRLLGDVCLNQGSSDSPYAHQQGGGKDFSGSTSPNSKVKRLCCGSLDLILLPQLTGCTGGTMQG